MEHLCDFSLSLGEDPVHSPSSAQHSRLFNRLSSQNGLLQNLSLEAVFLHKRKCYTVSVHLGFLCVV